MECSCRQQYPTLRQTNQHFLSKCNANHGCCSHSQGKTSWMSDKGIALLSGQPHSQYLTGITATFEEHQHLAFSSLMSPANVILLSNQRPRYLAVTKMWSGWPMRVKTHRWWRPQNGRSSWQESYQEKAEPFMCANWPMLLRPALLPLDVVHGRCLIQDRKSSTNMDNLIGWQISDGKQLTPKHKICYTKQSPLWDYLLLKTNKALWVTHRHSEWSWWHEAQKKMGDISLSFIHARSS